MDLNLNKLNWVLYIIRKKKDKERKIKRLQKLVEISTFSLLIPL